MVHEAMFHNCDIVVAHYSEDLEWLKPYAKYAIVYHKGKEDKPRFPVKKWVKVKNVGREGETYLQHIVNNYDSLADITIFLQGGMHDQLDDVVAYKNLEDYIKEVKKYGFSTRRMWFIIRREPQIKFDYKFSERYNNGSIRHAKDSFSCFYKKIFGKKQPLILPCFFHANFAVRKEKIIGREKDFYEKIRERFIDHSNPEEGHYLERLRFKIFNDSLNFYFFMKIIKNIFISLSLKIKR